MSVLDADSLREEIAKSGFWYQNIELAPGIWTNPRDPQAYDPGRRWSVIEPHIPKNLSGKTVLDLGCNAGFFAAKMKQRGAERVVAVDAAPWFAKQASLVAAVFGVDIEIQIQDAHEFCVETREKFDYALCLGLLYHLRHPLLVLDRLSCMLRETLLVETKIVGRLSDGSLHVKDDYAIDEVAKVLEHPDFPRLSFIEKKLDGDLSNWWLTNESCLLAMLRSSGYRRIARIGYETFMCEPPRVPLFDGFSYNCALAEQLWHRGKQASEES